ncbi:MAG TPA: DUF3084 domain-containing protein [Candidatus Baltobacteraceae bacterium]
MSLDTLRGIAIVVFIVLLAGAIAYAGDRVGHQIGRKRLTLYNIRPRYTSTIIAVGTGMLIALVVTAAALVASSEVRAAIFQENTISQKIAGLEAREKQLEAKVNNAQIVVPIGQPISPAVARFPRDSTPDLRFKIARQFYADTVTNANRNLAPPLKPFVPPADLNSKLRQLAEAPEIEQKNANVDVYLVAYADHNLFAEDRIGFAVRTFQDVLVVKAGTELGRGTIPSGPNVNLSLVIAQLQQRTVDALIGNGLPSYFVGTPDPVKFLPSQQQMQRMLTTSGGSYAIAAFAAEDIYPHTFLNSGSIPIVVVAQAVK